MIWAFSWRRADKPASRELEAAYDTLAMGGPPTDGPWDVVERLVVDWPAVEAAWGTVERLTGAPPDVSRCHACVIRRYLHARRDPAVEAAWDFVEGLTEPQLRGFSQFLYASNDPAVETAQEMFERLTGGEPLTEAHTDTRSHPPSGQRRYVYSLIDLSRPLSFDAAMWRSDAGDAASFLCDTTSGYEGIERSLIKNARRISRARERADFLHTWSVDGAVYPDADAALTAGAEWTTQTGHKAQLFPDGGGWRVVSKTAADELRRQIKRDGRLRF